MTTTLLFVTGKMPIARVNDFLREHQAIKDLAENSLCSLIRGESVAFNEIDDGTEPPVKDFESGFVGASTDDLWKQLGQYLKDESKVDQGGILIEHLILALDETASEKDTVLTLYQANDGTSHSWRTPFRFVPAVMADLPDEDETYVKPEMYDQDGVIDMKKIKSALGVKWRYGDAQA